MQNSETNLIKDLERLLHRMFYFTLSLDLKLIHQNLKVL